MEIPRFVYDTHPAGTNFLDNLEVPQRPADHKTPLRVRDRHRSVFEARTPGIDRADTRDRGRSRFAIKSDYVNSQELLSIFKVDFTAGQEKNSKDLHTFPYATVIRSNKNVMDYPSQPSRSQSDSWLEGRRRALYQRQRPRRTQTARNRGLKARSIILLSGPSALRILVLLIPGALPQACIGPRFRRSSATSSQSRLLLT